MCASKRLLLCAIVVTSSLTVVTASLRQQRTQKADDRSNTRTLSKSSHFDSSHCLHTPAVSNAELGANSVVIRCGLGELRGPWVEWYFQGVSLRDRHPHRYMKYRNIERFGRYERMRNGNLRIYSVRPRDAGLYVCQDKRDISSSVGNCRANSFTVTYRPVINHEMYRKRLLAYGLQSTVSCDVSGSPAPRISWLKDGKPIEIGKHSRYSQTVRGYLVLSNTTWTDSGVYTCVADNTHSRHGRTLGGRTKVNVSIAVVRPDSHLANPPVITNAPRNRRVRLNAPNFVLTCGATGGPYTNIHWSFASENRSLGPSGIHHKTLENPHRHEIPTLISQLRIARFTRQHVGTYTCTAKNQAGKAVASARVRLRNRSWYA